MKISKLFIICVGFFLAVETAVGKQNKTFLDYIDKYHKIAVAEMKEYGVPASITLAQGLLESGAGQSQLTRESNNHFGIKCHDWKGDRVYFDDDEKGECFRKYDNPEESFRDHCLFLVGRPRYASLFELKTTDYKGWAKGLKQCGYATDPNYATRLIGIIEEYELNKYDKDVKEKKKDNKEEEQKKDDKKDSKDDKKNKDEQNKRKEIKYKLQSSMGSIDVTNTHVPFKKDKKHVVIAQNGDTYESIAKEFGLKKWEIRWYNKVKKGEIPAEGSTVVIKKW